MNTAVNSPMAQNAVGILKNTAASGIGMTLSEYHFSMLNFVGLIVNAIGAFWYSYLKVRGQELDEPQGESNSDDEDVFPWTRNIAVDQTENRNR